VVSPQRGSGHRRAFLNAVEHPFRYDSLIVPHLVRVKESRQMGVAKSGGVEGCSSGVYLIDAAQRQRILAGEAFPPGFFVAVIDGERAGSRAGIFTEMARVLRFPDYFGRNWDAVYDCLTDMSWLPADGYVIVVDGFGRLATAEPDQWAIGLKVLREACAFWRPLSRPMFALLSGPSGSAPGVPSLPAACLAERAGGER
jgi:hypothetical protein